MKRIVLPFTIFFLLMPWRAYAQADAERELTVAERNAQQGFNDTIDRLAPDFVLVSLMIADPTDWRDDLLGTQGHAFLRLQCPIFDLDYCFSYESENVNTQIGKYARGKLKMGMFAIPTDEYLQDYRQWNRAVHEYRLNLPPEVEQRLWEIMDNKLSKGLSMKLDLSRRGCAITAVYFIKEALGSIPIIYPEGTRYESLSRREILYSDMIAHPWLRLFTCAMVPNKYDKDCPIDEKLIAPADLAEIWQQSTVNGQVLATYIGDIVESDHIESHPTWFTPQVVSWGVLVLTLLMVVIGVSYWDWVLLSIQALLGLFMLYLAFFTQQFGGAGPLMMVLLNPLPICLWHWRKYWQIPYAILLAVEAVVLMAWPHMLVDPAYIILIGSYILLFIREPFSQWLKLKK